MSDLTHKRGIGLLSLILAVAGMSGCTGLTGRLSGDIPRSGSLIPNTTFQITPLLAIPLEKIVFWGGYAGAAYLILDPYAPNWEIEEAQLPRNQFHLALKMKRYYSGGGGEARSVFTRRARDLMRQGGYDGYEVLEYNESLESSLLGSQRVAQGVIRLTGLGVEAEPAQGDAMPARMTPESAKKPRS